MVMLGIYETGKIPFVNILLHGLVKDPLGKKMSKSKGNVVNPLQLVDEYGADAVRFALVHGTATGNDQSLSYPKLQAARNFSNKLWNIARYILEFKPENAHEKISNNKEDKEIIKKLNECTEKVTESIERFRFHDAADTLYEFIWHEFADKYVESTKNRRSEAQPCLEYVYKTCLVLLHPIMPFITEEIYQKFEPQKNLIVEAWPFDSAHGRPANEKAK